MNDYQLENRYDSISLNLTELQNKYDKLDFKGKSNAIELLAVSIEKENNLPKLSLNDMPIENNGRLKFRDRAHFLNFYRELNVLNNVELKLGSQSVYYLNEEDTTVLDPMGVLLSFERNFDNFTSIRRIETLQNSLDLLNGLDPSMLRYGYGDNVMSALFNSDLQVEIGDSIFWQFSDVMFIVKEENVLNQIENGRINENPKLNPWEVDPNIVIINERRNPEGGPCDDIDASFSSSGYGLNYNFTFTGSPSPNSTDATVYFYWDFGDGSPSSKERNPSHTFPNSGTFTVSLYLEVAGVDDEGKKYFCNDMKKVTIKVEKIINPGDCEWFEALKATFVWNNTDGVFCFTPIGDLFSQIHDQDMIVSYTWNFGDGEDSNDEFPCHTFPCDDTYYVTLKVTTQEGCQWRLTLPVTVSVYGCCARNSLANKTKKYTLDGKTYQLYIYESLNPWWPYYLTFQYQLSAKMRHWKKCCGVWWRNKANLELQVTGNGFTPNNGCDCQNAEDISTDPGEYIIFSSSLIHEENFPGRMQTRYGEEWYGDYKLKKESGGETENYQKKLYVHAYCGG